MNEECKLILFDINAFNFETVLKKEKETQPIKDLNLKKSVNTAIYDNQTIPVFNYVDMREDNLNEFLEQFLKGEEEKATMKIVPDHSENNRTNRTF